MGKSNLPPFLLRYLYPPHPTPSTSPQPPPYPSSPGDIKGPYLLIYCTVRSSSAQPHQALGPTRP